MPLEDPEEIGDITIQIIYDLTRRDKIPSKKKRLPCPQMAQHKHDGECSGGEAQFFWTVSFCRLDREQLEQQD